MKLSKTFRHVQMKLYRIRDFPEAVAIGLAWGVSISFTPLLGLHLIICYLGTISMRGNLIAATVGSVIGNPWTFPFFFYGAYKIGIIFFFTPLDSYEFKSKKNASGNDRRNRSGIDWWSMAFSNFLIYQ